MEQELLLGIIAVLLVFLVAICLILLRFVSQLVKKINQMYRWQDNFEAIEVGQKSNSEVLAMINQAQRHLLDVIYHNNQQHEQKLENIRSSVDNKLQHIQADSAAKLEQMRQVVEEKLQSTIEKRLSSSFELVSQRLDLVHRGLGEMQILANSVGDLRNMLNNVKVRGTWGEVQLESILAQMMLPSQYEKNVAIVPGTTERVEFAIKLPGNRSDDAPIFLPIDAKFPLSDYERLRAAELEIEGGGDDRNNSSGGTGQNAAKKGGKVVTAGQQAKNLESFIKKAARTISEKYVVPPYSTDFAIMFLPLESLYAEVLQRPGIVEEIQREYRIIIAGPTTLAAILNSLQMGFRTLAIAQRSSEIWEVLEGIKKEFGNFSTLLAKTKAKLEQAGEAIGLAERKSQRIEKRLVRFAKSEPAALPKNAGGHGDLEDSDGV